MSMLEPERLENIVHKAATTVFETMLDMKLTPLASYREQQRPQPSGGVLSLVGFAGVWTGTGTFSCTAEMACRIADALFMSEHGAVEEEVLDAVAEMTNMILGNVKTELEEILGPMLLSIPTVIYGRNFVKRSLGNREWTVFPFDINGEKVEVQMCLGPSETPDPLRPGFVRPYGVHV